MGPLPPYPLKVGACFSQSSYINRAFRPWLSRNTVCLPICGTTTSASPEHSVIPDAVMNLCDCSFALIEYSCFVESEDGLVKPWLATLSTSHDLQKKCVGLSSAERYGAFGLFIASNATVTLHTSIFFVFVCHLKWSEVQVLAFVACRIRYELCRHFRRRMDEASPVGQVWRELSQLQYEIVQRFRAYNSVTLCPLSGGHHPVLCPFVTRRLQ